MAEEEDATSNSMFRHSFGKTTYFESETGRKFRRQSFFLFNPDNFNGMNDFVNVLWTDGKRKLLLGTERGFVFLFDMDNNRMVGHYKTDGWITDLRMFISIILSVGNSRACILHSTRGLKRVFRLKNVEEIHGYGPKGIIFFEIGVGKKVIYSSGYTKFKILNCKSRKLLVEFDLRTFSNVPSTMSNSLALQVCNLWRSAELLSVIFENDDYIHYFDILRHKYVQGIRLFDRSLVTDVQLSNSCLLTLKDYQLVILQFRDVIKVSKKNPAMKSIMYIFHYDAKSEKPINLVFHYKLRMNP